MEHIDYDKLLSEFHEEAYEITLHNKQLGVSASVPVFPSNTLKQVIEGYHDLVGIPAHQVPLYLGVINFQSKARCEVFGEACSYALMLGRGKILIRESSIPDSMYDVNTTLEDLGIKSGSTISFMGL